MMKVAVLGAGGFAGEKLVELLLNHPSVEITYLTSLLPKPLPYSEIFPKFRNKIRLVCENLDMHNATNKADFFFLALPHTVSMQIVPILLKKGKKVIDFSADYRLRNFSVYEKFYGKSHKDKNNLRQAVYGLPEFFKDKIRKAKLVANPGCYATSIILALGPLLKEGLIELHCIVDAKSSITGAGRKSLLDYHYSNIADNIWAYKPFCHQHLAEIIQILKDISSISVKVNFVPHVEGVDGGIYSTIYISFKKKTSNAKLKQVYKKYYKSAPFIRVFNDLPKLRDVVGTNFCDIGFALQINGKEAVIVSSIDNLIKGAAGSAIQNMNIMQGFKETDGLLL